MELYERQLNFIESILTFHPEFIEIFSPEERTIFKKYFLPDWDVVKNCKEYHQSITWVDASIEERATDLLRRFLQAYDVKHSNLLP